MRTLLLTLLASLLPCACASRPDGTPLSRGDRATPEAPPWAAPPLAAALSIRDGLDGRELSLETLFERLAEADVVFLGETHVDETTHRFELAVYEELLARRDGRVVLGLEMFERDVQADLDDYLAGRIDEARFLERSRPWGQYVTAYRPLIERARAGRAGIERARAGAGSLPVVASNFPRPLLRRLAEEGPAVLDALAAEESREVPAQLFPNTALYRRRADNAVRGHLGMMRRDEGDPERLYDTQTLWDNAMGDACARALDEHPGHAVLHVNGGFHTAYWDGTARQLKLRQPGAEVLTVAILPAVDPATAELGGAPVANYVVFAQALATDRDEGKWSVQIPRALEYRLHLPPGASAEAPVPLLVWLGDDGLDARDGLALWRERLGDEVAIAALDAPYREAQEDLSDGGRWFWPESFPEDVAALDTAVERVWGYVLRHFPVDPRRVCLAGEGTGATVVAAVSLLNQRMAAEAVALEPRRFGKIRDFPLPLPEDRGADVPVDKSLRLLLAPSDEAWWEEELQQYAAIGLDARQSTVTEDPWRRELERENALRKALGLEARAPAPGDERRYVALEERTPRARLWSRLEALRLGAERGQTVAVLEDGALPEDSSQRIDLVVRPDQLRALPRCPGAFGGTTVLVLPAELPASEREAWLALEADDPLAVESRFHRLRLAVTGGENDLPAVLSQLLSEGRTNVLVVPAAFCADADTLRALRRSVEGLADRLSLHWTSGLGGP